MLLSLSNLLYNYRTAFNKLATKYRKARNRKTRLFKFIANTHINYLIILFVSIITLSTHIVGTLVYKIRVQNVCILTVRHVTITSTLLFIFGRQ